MQLKELLDHTGSSLLGDRSSPISGNATPAWGDEVLVRYFNQAEKLFARKTLCIQDSTTVSTCTVNLTEAVSTYVLASSVIKIYSVAMSDTPRFSLSPAPYTALQPYLGSQGRPQAWSPGEAFRKITVAPVPNADAGALTLLLRVARMPITDLTLANLTASPEIPEEYHLDLCDWVAYRCLVGQDIDDEAQNDAQRFRAAFDLSMRRARRDIQILSEPESTFSFGGWGNDA